VINSDRHESDRARLVALLDTSCDAPPDAVDALQRHGLTALLTARPATLAEISEQTGINIDELRLGVVGLTEAGRIEFDGSRIVGIVGLTLRTTAHRVVLPDATMHTWCALDAIGIPAALALDADVSTTCPHCDASLRVEIRDGEPSPNPGVRLFCPTAPCSDVRADFCTAANLFCSPDHLQAWTIAHSKIDGDELDLTETAALGRAMWDRHR
jgi:alkylmercury lyase-like protein